MTASLCALLGPLPTPPLAVHEFIWGHSIEDLFLMGGAVMWPLLLCSVIATAIIFERLLVFARFGRVPRKLAATVADAMALRMPGEAAAAIQKSGHPMAEVLRVQVGLADRPIDERTPLVQREGGLLLERLEARLSPLLLVAQAAPLLGLLGTVSGLVGSFWKLEQLNGPVQPSDLAAGIWAALLTTVFGLIVGIPASAAWHLLQDRADGFARHMGFAVTEVEEGIARGRAALPRSASPATSVPPNPAQAAASL
ncbi:Biopolymer transport protein ExbB [Planctomycetes bacterium Poly30]|uniref:Biopolymer transport protein ExbB n=1 Tax=Saltatorellus ferox TaxID=2528018 RepID=A0A518F1D3_9BACT|nr:Biopolymer transport protein ExbB [Planctomycetes bacterium Poly30]